MSVRVCSLASRTRFKHVCVFLYARRLSMTYSNRTGLANNLFFLIFLLSSYRNYKENESLAQGYTQQKDWMQDVNCVDNKCSCVRFRKNHHSISLRASGSRRSWSRDCDSMIDLFMCLGMFMCVCAYLCVCLRSSSSLPSWSRLSTGLRDFCVYAYLCVCLGHRALFHREADRQQGSKIYVFMHIYVYV